MTAAVKYLTDPADFCRTCKGWGHYPEGGCCDDCGGSGCKSVRITPKPEETNT